MDARGSLAQPRRHFTPQDPLSSRGIEPFSVDHQEHPLAALARPREHIFQASASFSSRESVEITAQIHDQFAAPEAAYHPRINVESAPFDVPPVVVNFKARFTPAHQRPQVRSHGLVFRLVLRGLRRRRGRGDGARTPGFFGQRLHPEKQLREGLGLGQGGLWWRRRRGLGGGSLRRYLHLRERLEGPVKRLLFPLRLAFIFLAHGAARSRRRSKVKTAW